MQARENEGLGLSVIIPSHFRPDALRRVLEGLSRQTFQLPFEVVVALDGGCAESAQMMSDTQWPFMLRYLSQPQRGATSARNLALRAASGTIVVVLDDDVIPTPSLLATHVSRHDQATPTLVIGTFKRSPESPEPITQSACDWSHLHPRLLQEAGMDQTKLASLVADGNLSAPRTALLAIGGWDEAIGGVGGSDDLDLARRWLAAGYLLQPEPPAIGEHYWCKTWSDHLRDQRNIGRAHRYIYEKNPELRPKLDFARITGRSAAHRFLAAIARQLPDFFFKTLHQLVKRFGTGLRRSYGGITTGLIRFSGVMFYLRGFAEGYISNRVEAHAL